MNIYSDILPHSKVLQYITSTNYIRFQKCCSNVHCVQLIGGDKAKNKKMAHLFLFPFAFFFLPLFLEVLGDLDSVFFSGALGPLGVDGAGGGRLREGWSCSFTKSLILPCSASMARKVMMNWS